MEENEPVRRERWKTQESGEIDGTGFWRMSNKMSEASMAQITFYRVTVRHTSGTDETRSNTCAEREKSGAVWGVSLECPGEVAKQVELLRGGPQSSQIA